MKFRNPSFKFFLNGRTNGRTDKPKAICSPLFQSWGHKNAVVSEKASFNFHILMTLGQSQEMTFTNTHIPLLTPLVVCVYHLSGHRQL